MFSQADHLQNASHFAVISRSFPAGAGVRNLQNPPATIRRREWTPGLGKRAGWRTVLPISVPPANRYYAATTSSSRRVRAYAYNRQEPLLFARGGFRSVCCDQGSRKATIPSPFRPVPIPDLAGRHQGDAIMAMT